LEENKQILYERNLFFHLVKQRSSPFRSVTSAILLLLLSFISTRSASIEIFSIKGLV
jgi:hypothetical protein